MASKDEHNYSSSPHRMPTVSAAEALDRLNDDHAQPLKTSLPSLDAALQRKLLTANHGPSGISRGEITEIFGPPGAGKTTIALHVAAIALRNNAKVVWVDGSYPVIGTRLCQILDFGNDNESEVEKTRVLKRFHHFQIPSLAHLIALVTNTSDTFPPTGTSLLVVDSISSLFAQVFSKLSDEARPDSISEHSGNGETPSRMLPPSRAKTANVDNGQWAARRRFTVMADLANRLVRIATTRNLAVLLISQTTMRIKAGCGAMLYPATSGGALWEQHIRNRLVVYRDWITGDESNTTSQESCQENVRFVRVTKAQGIQCEGQSTVTAFVIQSHTLNEIPSRSGSSHTKDNEHSRTKPDYSHANKRRRLEVADSESDDEQDIKQIDKANISSTPNDSALDADDSFPSDDDLHIIAACSQSGVENHCVDA